MILFLARDLAAQPPAGDDLELPATPAGAASAAPAPAAPAASGAPKPATAPLAPAAAASAPPPPSATETEIAELRRRLEALEKAKAESEKPAPKPKTAARDGASVNLERRARTRVVPLGFRVGGYLQAQYERSQASEDQLQQGGDPLNQNRFLLRRGRIRFDHGFEYAAAALELDANTVRGPSVSIRRAEATVLYRAKENPEDTPLVAATLGVMDIPFGYELGVEGSRARAFMERSIGSGALFPTEADVGLEIWGAYSFLRYAVALMNGEPLDSRGFPRDPNAAKDLIGRIGADATPLELLSVMGGLSFATGKGFHPGQGATKDSFAWSDTNVDGAIDVTELVPVPGSAASPSENFERWALGLDLGVTFHTKYGDTRVYGETFVASNYDRGFMPADPVSTSGIDVRHTSAYGAIVQDVTRYGLAGFRIAFYDPNSDEQEQRRGQFLPLDQSVLTLSPLVGLQLKNQARLLLQYDFVNDQLGRDARGVPAGLKNDLLTVRLQVEL
jgi:hypothetical protein